MYIYIYISWRIYCVHELLCAVVLLITNASIRLSGRTAYRTSYRIMPLTVDAHHCSLSLFRKGG